MAWQTWWLYLIASIGLSLTPGPNSLLAITHGALHGHRNTRFTIAGGAIGFIALIGLSLAGIGALLQASPGALGWMKWLGGGYLVWLGVKVWRAPALQLTPVHLEAARRRSELFREGLLAAVSNPKALLFYGAFLPQFVDPKRSLWEQFVVMAATFALIECVVEWLLARLAHRVRPWLEQHGKRFNRICGGLFGLMGAGLPFSG